MTKVRIPPTLREQTGGEREVLAEGETVEVHLLSRGLRPADLVVIGSHCVGLDYLLGRLQEQGFRCKFLAVGSTGGLLAARRGECDLAGIHLMDPVTGEYNRPLLPNGVTLVPGYGRLQGIVTRISVRSRIILLAAIPVLGFLVNGIAFTGGGHEVAEAFRTACSSTRMCRCSSCTRASRPLPH